MPSPKKQILDFLNKNPNTLYSCWEINESVYQSRAEIIFLLDILRHLISDKKVVTMNSKYTSSDNKYYKKIKELEKKADKVSRTKKVDKNK